MSGTRRASRLIDGLAEEVRLLLLAEELLLQMIDKGLPPGVHVPSPAEVAEVERMAARIVDAMAHLGHALVALVAASKALAREEDRR